MNICIDISQVAYEGTGVGRYTKGVVESVLNYDTKNTWTFLFSGFRKKLPHDLVTKIKNSRHRLVTLPFPPTFLSFMWNTMHIGSIEYIVGPQDWCITSDWTEPPAQCKKATIIHDLTVFQHPETVDTTILRTQKKRLQWVVKESDLIIAVSDATAMDIAQFLPHIRGVVQTIPSGASITLPPDKACDAVQKKYNLTQPFILSVGKLEPRKNIARLIEAFTKLQKENLELVIVGQKGWGTEIKPVPHVHFVGLITDIELSALYERCLFFAYPSLWEGFGYPVVEAMLHKKAVLTSTTPSLQKLGEQGGTTCNPESVEDIARNLLLLATDTGLRTQKAEQGYLFVQRFSWKTYYETLIQTLYAHRS